ncbi:unnamed protein product [Protopolystoma xenopodis]|uniref:Uncharacterized protein n=1 Tax=Protopolystoma xenopodis TaxID=117903 RepID=A0A3S5AMY9_9PLAT|nr:unnamed protein product [Protopolystoma xenopodis]
MKAVSLHDTEALRHQRLSIRPAENCAVSPDAIQVTPKYSHTADLVKTLHKGAKKRNPNVSNGIHREETEIAEANSHLKLASPSREKVSDVIRLACEPDLSSEARPASCHSDQQLAGWRSCVGDEVASTNSQLGVSITKLSGRIPLGNPFLMPSESSDRSRLVELFTSGLRPKGLACGFRSLSLTSSSMSPPSLSNCLVTDDCSAQITAAAGSVILCPTKQSIFDTIDAEIAPRDDQSCLATYALGPSVSRENRNEEKIEAKSKKLLEHEEQRLKEKYELEEMNKDEDGNDEVFEAFGSAAVAVPMRQPGVLHYATIDFAVTTELYPSGSQNRSR